MASLYELTQEELSLLGRLEDLEGEVTPEIEQELNSIEHLTNEKLENYCKLMANLDSDILSYENEIKRLAHKKKVKSNIIERLKESIKGYLLATEKEKVELPLFTLSFRTSKEVFITSENIPEAFLRIKTEPDKILIKKSLADGEILPFAEFKTNKSLQIK